MGGLGVLSIGAYRTPVTYNVQLRQDYEGGLAVWVRDVADDPRSRRAVADALRRAASMIDDSVEHAQEGQVSSCANGA